MHHQQCSEIPLTPSLRHLLIARPHMPSCMATTDSVLLKTQHETSLPPQILCVVNHFANLWIERHKCPDPSGSSLWRSRSYSQFSFYMVGVGVYRPGLGVSCQTLLCCVQSAAGVKSASWPLGHLNISSAHSRAGCDCSSVRPPSWQEKECLCSSSIFDSPLFNNAESSNVLQKAVLLTRRGAALLVKKICWSRLA